MLWTVHLDREECMIIGITDHKIVMGFERKREKLIGQTGPLDREHRCDLIFGEHLCRVTRADLFQSAFGKFFRTIQ
jgi:hypothetical protein